MAEKCLLFTYGLLMPGRSPPKSCSEHWPDRVKGRLYDLGQFPGATGLGQGDGWVEGATLELDADELPTLDEFEDTDSGEFRRVLVTTEAGYIAWAYEYQLKIPDGLTPRERWR